ncbi:MAG TPA: tRNA (5-methylaminomethyl-2-thiouridine)(34)-methyltransferase MnmD [Cryomorphaceae bacterium]|nr:tRNA (5-methylaminomethyl-2-thiouridine)(34)-methyltransferase MnmD [Cryomorphaceae bacterium]
MKKLQIVDTKDGSKSLYLPELDETYHSHHGALQESQHVYIKSGIEFLLEKEKLASLRIFELGFGTGLNAFLTADFARNAKKKIYYRTIEKFPISLADHCSLEYSTLLSSPDYAKDCHAIAEAPWNMEVEVNPYFTMEKIEGDFFDYSIADQSFDVLYFDAFGYRAQSELWEKESFEICASVLRKGGVLVTYAAKGLARRNMISVGLEVEKIPGAPGKREMMRATKVQ